MSAIKSSSVLPGEYRRESVLARRGESEKLEKIPRRRFHLSYILKERAGFTQTKRKEELFRKLAF